MIGGFIKGKKMKIDSLQFFLVILVVFLIKAWLVQWSYNRIMPKLVYNVNGKQGDFRRLSYMEAIIVVILFNNLFNR
tara:strand:+ start:322 stop:552 length:231 start_codon:yes stop_codon:yes gene_type:complete